MGEWREEEFLLTLLWCTRMAHKKAEFLSGSLTTINMYPYTQDWLIAPIMHVVQKFISYLSTFMKWDEGNKKYP